MTAPPIVITDLGDLARYLIRRFNQLEDSMATKAELDAALTRLQTAVTAKVQEVSDRLTAMQTTLAQFQSDDATEDAAYQATIADLRAQLESQLNDAVAAVDAMAQAVGQPAQG